MNVYSQLVKASFENSASDLATTSTGLVYFNTGSSILKWYDGSAWRTAVTTDQAQTLTAKTITSAELDTPLIDDYFDINEESAPSTPGANKVRVYAKSDGKLYKKDDTGAETELGGGGTGEINVILNPNDATNWVASGAGITVATSTTSSDLPLGGVIPTAIKITPASGTDYVRYRWTMPASLKGRKLKVAWEQRPLSGYASGDLKLEVYQNAASDYTGAYTEFALSTDSSGTTSLSSASGKFTTTFDCDTSDYYELRIVRTAGTTAFNIVSVVVGPGTQPQGAVVGEWVSWTPTGTWLTNTTYTGKYRRVGDSAQFSLTVATSGAPTSANLTVTLPFTIDTAKLTDSTSNNGSLGQFTALDSGTAIYFGFVHYNSTTTVKFNHETSSATNGVMGTDVSQAAPMTWASGDKLIAEFTVPIAEWTGAGTVNVTQNDVEYAYNSNTADSDNTSAFAYGPGGVAFGSYTGTKAKTVRFQTPIQATDEIVLEVDNGNGNWVSSDQFFPWGRQNTTEYGFYADPQSTDTDVIVRFRDYAVSSGATFASAGTAWSSFTTYKWRVKKVAGGAAVGFGAATSTANGLVSREVTATEGDIGALTWSAAVAPSGAITKRYKRYQVGKLVKIQWRIEAAVAGTTVTDVSFDLPADCPNPSNMTNQSNSEWVATGYGKVDTVASGALFGGGAGLFKTGGGAYTLFTYAVSAGAAATFAIGEVSYIID